MNPFTSRWIALAVLLPLALLPACGRGAKDAPADSSASPHAGAANPRLASQMPGALTKPIDDYTGEELRLLTARLHFGGGHDRERRCRNDPRCAGPAGARSTVRVDAVIGQDSIGPANIARFGVVQIKAVNRGMYQEERYGFKPDARFEYFMIVTSDGAGGLRWRLEELDTRATPATHRQVGSGTLKDCQHRNWTPGAQADFKSCAAAAAADSVKRLGLVLQGQGLDDPLWTECNVGCCTFVT